MRCKCGYCFSREALEGLRKNVRKFESYAVVNSRHYMIFLRRELEVLKCHDENKKLAAIAESSQYAGSLLECPKCSRLLFLKPETGDPAFYKRDD